MISFENICSGSLTSRDFYKLVTIAGLLFFDNSHLTGVVWCLIVVLNCVSLMISDMELLFIHLYLFTFLDHFKIRLLILLAVELSEFLMYFAG